MSFPAAKKNRPGVSPGAALFAYLFRQVVTGSEDIRHRNRDPHDSEGDRRHGLRLLSVPPFGRVI
jgi:hypothetical protein